MLKLLLKPRLTKPRLDLARRKLSPKRKIKMLTNFRLVYFNGHLGSDLNLLAWSNFKYSYLFSTSRDCCTTLLHPIRVLHPLHLHSRHHCTSSLHPRGKNCQIKIYYFQFIILDLVRFPNLPTPSLTLPDSFSTATCPSSNSSTCPETRVLVSHLDEVQN